MPRVILTRALAAQTQGQLEHSVTGATVAEALAPILSTHPLLRRYLFDDQARLRQHINLFINDTLITDRAALSDPLAPHDSLYILQAVSGGAA